MQTEHWMAANSETKPANLTPSLLMGCYRLHLPSPFIIITQPESWHSHGEWIAEST